MSHHEHSHGHHHGHSHDHGHGHHHHVPDGVRDGVLLWTVVVNIGLSVFEFIAGLISGSVALMADALHNTNDAAALLVAYVARKIARREADEAYTFGYRRAELIGAMIQLTALIVVGIYLVYEAVRRYFEPEPLKGGWIMAAATVALVVDIVTAWLLWAMAKGSMNLKAAFLHNLTDAAASIAVLLGGAAIYWLGWRWVDPTLTLIIAGYILYMSFGMLRRTSSILMQRTPLDINLQEVQSEVEKLDGVAGLHHLHVWELDEENQALEAHIVIDETTAISQSDIKRAVKQLLHDTFGIKHSTLELEGPGEEDCCDDTCLIPRH